MVVLTANRTMSGGHVQLSRSAAGMKVIHDALQRRHVIGNSRLADEPNLVIRGGSAAERLCRITPVCPTPTTSATDSETSMTKRGGIDAPTCGMRAIARSVQAPGSFGEICFGASTGLGIEDFFIILSPAAEEWFWIEVRHSDECEVPALQNRKLKPVL